MKHVLLSVTLVLALGFISTHTPAEELAGYDRLDVWAAHRANLIAASVWYPAGTTTYRAPLGDGALFKGNFAYVGAAVAGGTFPLVLLSHGSGGNMDALAWLSSALALRGAMVLAVNHPGSTTGDSSPRRSVLLDARAADLSAALDQVLTNPAFAPHVDRTRISAVGFSLGGTTTLNLAGLRFDRQRYQAYCRQFQGVAEDCGFFRKGGVDLHNLPSAFSADARDARIRAAVAIDPGFTYAATSDSVSRTTIPVLLLNLGEDTLWPAADVGPKGSNLSALMPDAMRVVIAPAHHFTFLAECKPDGAKMLHEEGDDPICDDPKGTDRASVHARIVDQLARFLELGAPTDTR